MTKSNTYEMMFILRPDLNQEQINKQMHKYTDFLKEHGAERVSMEVWGKRRLAYPIEKFTDGIYILTYYTGDGTQVAPIERDMRLGEEVIRYLTIKHKGTMEFEEKEIPDVEAIPVSSPQPQPILAEDIPKEETKENVTETETVKNVADSAPETTEDNADSAPEITEKNPEVDNTDDNTEKEEPVAVEA